MAGHLKFITSSQFFTAECLEHEVADVIFIFFNTSILNDLGVLLNRSSLIPIALVLLALIEMYEDCEQRRQNFTLYSLLSLAGGEWMV